MDDALRWEETEDSYRCGSAEARIMLRDPPAFVILTFGEGATAATALACILAAIPFGQIAIQGTDENRILARELLHQGCVRYTPFVGLPFDAFGVAAIRADLVGPPGKCET